MKWHPCHAKRMMSNRSGGAYFMLVARQNGGVLIPSARINIKAPHWEAWRGASEEVVRFSTGSRDRFIVFLFWGGFEAFTFKCK